MQNQDQSIFSQYCTILSKDHLKDRALPLKDHLQIPYIIDTLSRKENHHVILHGNFSEKINLSLLEGIASQITTGNIPKRLQNATLIYFDASHFCLANETIDNIAHDFYSFCNFNETEKPLIFAINDSSIFSEEKHSALGQLLKEKLNHDQWRLLILASTPPTQLQSLDTLFSILRLHEPTEKDLLAIIKTYRDEIESFHNIIMPDDVFSYALSLAKHYLGGKHQLDTALELLDSGAARASTLERNEQNAQTFKPILTTTILAHVVSNWTHIPLSHLHHNKFKLSKFLQHIQQKIVGQDQAINSVGTLLQSTCIKQKETAGTICNLLLVGPAGVGKNQFAEALAEYLFSSTEALLRVTFNKNHSANFLSDISVIIESTTIQQMRLLEAIQLKPYAIVLIENPQEMSSQLVDFFKNIFTYGYAFDEHDNKYDFRHAIIIITTTSGSENIAFTKKQTDPGSAPIMDLMQLVLNENTNPIHSNSHLTLQDINKNILPELAKKFPAEILRHSHIIPFLPLDQASIEKIIKFKLANLIKSLHDEFGIELTYAPEIIKFLAHETLKQNEHAQPLQALFEHHIHTTVANEILSRIDDKNRPKRLALLLNDSGQVLRSEFIPSNEATLYTI